jgi:hypothetical protein
VPNDFPTCAKEGKHMGNTSSGTNLNIFNSRSSFPRHQMVVVGGGGVGGAGEGGGQGPPPPPPKIFAKVAAKYTPLVLPPVLHDLPKNYTKNLPKFTREGDLTTT